MTTLVLAQIAALFVLLFLSAFFSSSESAFFSLNSLHLRALHDEHPATAQRIGQILHDPKRLLSTILIGNTLVNVVMAATGFAIASHFFPQHGELVSVVVITVLVLVLGEVGPKRIALFWPEKVASFYAPILLVIIRAFAPVRFLLEGITHILAPFFTRRMHSLSEEEFKTVVYLSHEEGILDKEEEMMVQAIIRLEDLQASEIMTPRIDIEGLDLEEDPAEYLQIARKTHVRHLVLYEGRLDRIVGCLDVRRFLLDPDHDIESAKVEPFYVPESCPLDSLLQQFQAGRKTVAIVVDEYGGTAGIVTRGDILEEIVGEIDDEIQDRDLLIEEISENKWLVNGQISLEDLNDRLKLNLSAEGVDRLSGWIVSHMERMPHIGDRIADQSVIATVRQMRRHRITSVQLELAEPSS